MSKKDLLVNKEAINIVQKQSRITEADREKLLRFKGNGSIAADLDSEYMEILDKNGINNTTNSFATPMPIIKVIWQIINQLGFSSGRILEPAAHIGRFMEAQTPEDRARSEWVLVEPDAIAHQISNRLHPDAIAQYNQRLEKAQLPEGGFDLIISNFPFGHTKPFDPSLETKYQGLTIHNYFWIKSLKLVREGGLIVGLTSTSTLDNHPKFLKDLAQEGANLVTAFRLPEGSFASENTNVTCDLIVIRKGGETTSPTWTETESTKSGLKQFKINKFYINHPGHLLGELTQCRLYGKESNVTALKSNQTLEENIKTILSYAPKRQCYKPLTDQPSIKEYLTGEKYLNLNPYEYFVEDGQVYQYRPEGVIVIHSESERIKDGLNLKSQLDQVTDLETTENVSEPELEENRKQLSNLYRKFVKNWGNLLKSKNQEIVKSDPKLLHLANSLEYRNDSGKIEEGTILTKRSSYPTRKITKDINSAEDALYYAYNLNQKINLTVIASFCNRITEEVMSELSQKELIFYDPQAKEWQLAQQYLNGDTKGKLYTLKNCDQAEWEKYRLKQNQLTLTKKNQKGEYIYLRPFLLPNASSEIRSAIAQQMEAEFDIPSETDPQAYFYASLGTPWLEPQDLKQFTEWLLGCEDGIMCQHNEQWAIWIIESTNVEAFTLSQKSAYATEEKDLITLINHGLNNDPPIIKMVDSEGRKLKRESSQATNNAVSKLEKIKEKLQEWLWSDCHRALRYTKKYNQLFPREVNFYQVRTHDSKLILAGSNEKIKLKPHQLQGIERSLLSQTTLLLWEVGSGKTYAICSSAYQAKQKGLANKPLIVVPKATVTDLVKSYRELYPKAKLLTITNENLTAGIAQLQCGDYDTAIMTHDCFYRIPISEETKIDYLRHELKLIEDILSRDLNQEIQKELKKDKLNLEIQIKELNLEQELKNSDNVEEELEAIKKVYQGKLKIEKNGKIKIKKKDDQAVQSQAKLEKAFHYYNKAELTNWEKLGVDYLLFDEAHVLKNLQTPSRIHRVQGATLPYTQRTVNSLLKFRYCEDKRNGKLLWATGTLPTNSLTEMYVAQRFLDPKTLEKKGLLSFDAWVGQFGQVETKLEITATGEQKEKSRLAKFKNLQELLDITQEFTDFVKARKVLKNCLPTPNYYTIVSPPTDEQQAINEHLNAIDKALQKRETITYVNRNGEPTEYNFLNVTSLGSTTAIDPRNVLPSASNDPYLKLNQVALNTFNIWKITQDFKGTQILFCDQGIPNKKRFTNHGYLREALIQLGIPSTDLAVISEVSDKKKKQLYQDINEGKIRILIGSTEKCGTGVNIQKKLVAIHHIDLPWAPYKKQQREGRIIRRGNTLKNVFIYQYGTLGKDNQAGFDSYKAKRIGEKSKFVEQFSSGNLSNEQRQTNDLEESDISSSVVSALLSGNQHQLKRLEKENKLTLNQQNLSKVRQQLHYRTVEQKQLPQQIKDVENRLDNNQRNQELVNNCFSNNELITGNSKFGQFRVQLIETVYEFKSKKEAVKFINQVKKGEYVNRSLEKLQKLRAEERSLPKTIQTLIQEKEQLEDKEKNLIAEIEELTEFEEKFIKSNQFLELDLSASKYTIPSKEDIKSLLEIGIYQILTVEGEVVNSHNHYQMIKEEIKLGEKDVEEKLQLELTLTNDHLQLKKERTIIPKQSTQGKQLSLF